jgi:photosystem II stability/assembly factor-like uncharacterized protein
MPRRRHIVSRHIPSGRQLLVVVVALALLASACGTGAEPDATATRNAAVHAVDGEPRGLAVDPRDGGLITVTATDVFRSADAGRTWQPLASSSEHDWAGIQGVLIDPAAPARLYLWGRGLGVVRSDDGGATWRAVTQGLPAGDVGALALDGAQRETLYAWVDGQGVYRTRDGGQHWTLLTAGPAAGPIRSLAHAAADDNPDSGRLYAATSNGMSASAGGGSGWRALGLLLAPCP